MTKEQCAWLAGLLEGEGTFGSFSRDGRTYPQMQLAMTDRDVIDRAALLMPVSITVSSRRRPYKKDLHVLRVRGSSARIVMEEVLPHMGERRAARIREVLYV